ncbi:MAG TPA: chromosome segregation protein SMC [Candidatus Atopostipes pullistercoris]|uniref:Chromosome partition protein Smc n=1 Tax=Candidatus Atopostipes pullistercoris TaxID=2838467 RepID=A0A9D2FZ43_9LACT|nr:chromosome segregation protein SMC [Candidatus Atopostipes pullistercoris]
MQLKKIILKGFKSFPEKTTLEFNQGVTAIVGPNGSGKSNIIEAIRWVMGEQSAKTLRGDRMNDVIFSGTNKRKPLNIAEVELILDNSDNYLGIDYEEVSVLRRISRTGDSTYMINQQECRLRDIVDLFMDSGLGKESFSIISQGKVEAIFNSKPEDRRGIFEEAAGVYKYKVRKQEAEKKLEQTQDNLDRVQDILYELESQLAPLKKQADIAHSFLDQKEKLTDLDISVTVWQIQHLTEKIKEDSHKKEQLEHDLELVVKEIKELEQKQIEQVDKLTAIEELREDINHKLIQVVREKERTEAALNLFDEKARHREAFIKEKETSIEQLTKRKSQLNKELEQTHLDCTTKEQALNEIKKEIEELKNKSAYLEGDKESQMEDLRANYIELLQQQTSLKNEKNYMEQELKRSNKDMQKASDKVTKLKQNIKKKKDVLNNKQEIYEKITEELFSLLNDYETTEQSLNESREDLRIRNARVNETTNELERAKAKQSSLKEMQDNYAGYYAGVRAVMKQKDHLDGIIGTVAELMEIPNKYVQAIDTVLGSSSQFIVVENEKSARDAINYLKQAKKGRATFLPLSTIKARNLSPKVKNQIAQMPGFIGIANELVTNDNRVQSIIDNLLGQTIIADSLESANKIARLIQYRNRVVSLEGDVINAGGSMTGGGRQNNKNPIFSHKVELESLTKFISENEKLLEQLINNRNKIEREKDNLEQEVEKIRVLGEDKRLEEQHLKNELSNLSEQVTSLERELKATSFEMNETNHIYDSYIEQLKETEDSLQTISKKVKESNESMQLLSSEQETIDKEKERLNQEIALKNDKRSDIRESLASVQANRQYIEEQISQVEDQISSLKLDIQSFDEELEVGSKEELEDVLNQYIKDESELLDQQKEIRKNYEDENKTKENLSEQLSQRSGRNQYLLDEKSKVDIRLSQNDVRMDHYLEYLVDEYKIGYEEARLLDFPEIELEKAKKQVKLLKKGIEELGPVNLNSIDEYKNVDDRFRFLTQQQDDLIEAKTNLYNTMDEMDSIVEKQFKETFDRIQEEFSVVFPKMFGGGNAELILNEPDNLLETGIEIIAQPPGKRLTRLSLLSGGERALTAISLLFAIIHVNPIPFCILDEAEAALDDANVVRFGQYLENFEDDTQFIVITHRKGTMEHSNQLYGVTMQERGISKIVSVSLNEAQQMDGVS